MKSDNTKAINANRNRRNLQKQQESIFCRARDASSLTKTEFRKEIAAARKHNPEISQRVAWVGG